MVGQGSNKELTPPYNAPQTNVKIWNGAWQPVAPGFGNNKNEFGPELAFAVSISKKVTGNVYLIKYASNGKALYNDFKPYEGRYYKEMMHTYKAALKNLDADGVKYQISGFLWMQGESDAYENQAYDYEKNLTEFIAIVRAELQTPNMPFVIGRVLHYFGGARPPKIGQQTQPTQAKIVRDAQVKVAQNVPCVAWINTDDYAVVDQIKNPGHYGSAGQISLGIDYADAILALSMYTHCG